MQVKRIKWVFFFLLLFIESIDKTLEFLESVWFIHHQMELVYGYSIAYKKRHEPRR